MPSEYGEVFPEPVAPAKPISYAHIHTHELTLAGAQLNPNKTWSSLWQCSLCPDIVIGGYIGRVPEGYCHACSWVQKKWPRKKCEECKTPLSWNRPKEKK